MCCRAGRLVSFQVLASFGVFYRFSVFSGLNFGRRSELRCHWAENYDHHDHHDDDQQQHDAAPQLQNNGPASNYCKAVWTMKKTAEHDPFDPNLSHTATDKPFQKSHTVYTSPSRKVCLLVMLCRFEDPRLHRFLEFMVL